MIIISKASFICEKCGERTGDEPHVIREYTSLQERRDIFVCKSCSKEHFELRKKVTES